MKLRGDAFLKWADSPMHCRTYDETLEDGCKVNVQTRLSVTGETQLFIGLYAKDGRAVIEEFYERLPGETMTRALLWGARRARVIAVGVHLEHHPELEKNKSG